MTLEQAGALVGDVVMKASTRAFKIDFTEDLGNFSIVPQGDVDSTSFVSTLNIVKAKINKTILGFQNAAAGRKMFFIVEDENGTYYLMGNKKRGCTFVAGGDGNVTGTTASDRNQASVQFTYRSKGAYVYEGDVEDLLQEQE
ncbi:MAG: hypothetical protein LBN95_07945 [Prevotellaceae bacterium]|jgi:hypothetical protein|nr:hypothetical protein [Prevotellaceae bacterium]